MVLAWLLLLSGLSPASAQAVEREKLDFLGWNKACSVAIAHYGYPKRGDGIEDDPVMTRIGTLTIAPGREAAKARWSAAWEGQFTWRGADAARLREDLKRAGYASPGVAETVLPGPVPPDWDLERVLLSTQTFRTKAPSGFPGPGWRLASVRYSPLGSCALLVYAKEGASRDFFTPLLIRVGNPAARLERAAGHVTNAVLLFQNGDAAGGLAETATAVQMNPDSAPAHYHRAAMLALTGSNEEALPELAAAVRLEPKYRQKARTDKDFESLTSMPRFKELTRR